jgi:hypothetical protein
MQLPATDCCGRCYSVNGAANFPFAACAGVEDHFHYTNRRQKVELGRNGSTAEAIAGAGDPAGILRDSGGIPFGES